jgi:hypothetical protein
MPSSDIQVAYVDKFVIPLLAKAGLKVKVTRKPEYTTLKISVKRAVQGG